MQSPSFANELFNMLAPHLPEFPYPASKIPRDQKNSATPVVRARPAHSMNSNIRLYKYTKGQHFGCHYDDSVADPVSGTHSEWTLLIYLSGKEDGVEGGEVRIAPNFIPIASIIHVTYNQLFYAFVS